MPKTMKAALAALKGHWLELLVMMSLPMLIASVSVWLAESSGLLSLFILPLSLPLFYNAYKRIWRLVEGIPSPSYSFQVFDYQANPGVRGAFGILLPTIACSLLALFLETVLFESMGDAIAIAFGHSDTVAEFDQLLNANSSSSSYLTNIYDYMSSEEFMVAYSAAIIITVSLSMTISTLIFAFWAEGRRFSYVAMQRILPDADRNIPGPQSRFMGKVFTRGFWSRRMQDKVWIFLPNMVIFLVVVSATVAGFSFWQTPYPTMVSFFPIVLSAFSLVPGMIVSGAMDVTVADSLLDAMKQSADPVKVNSIYDIFNNEAYVHSREKSGQRPFQASPEGRGRFYVSTIDNSGSEPSKGKPNASEDDGLKGNYGFIDLGKGSDEKSKDGNDKENK